MWKILFAKASHAYLYRPFETGEGCTFWAIKHADEESQQNAQKERQTKRGRAREAGICVHLGSRGVAALKRTGQSSM